MGKIKSLFMLKVDAEVSAIKTLYYDKGCDRDTAIKMLSKYFFLDDAGSIVDEWDFDIAKKNEEAAEAEIAAAGGAEESEDAG
jgi:hypothetical protein